LSDEWWLYLSKAIFGGSIVLVIYIVYKEWIKNRITAEQDEIEMGELKNEGIIDALSDAELVKHVNEDVGPKPPSSPTPKKPT